jgi:hypothetical protein
MGEALSRSFGFLQSGYDADRRLVTAANRS